MYMYMCIYIYLFIYLDMWFNKPMLRLFTASFFSINKARDNGMFLPAVASGFGHVAFVERDTECYVNSLPD